MKKIGAEGSCNELARVGEDKKKQMEKFSYSVYPVNVYIYHFVRLLLYNWAIGCILAHSSNSI